MPIICLEGPDGAGKTTLASEIATLWRAKGDTYSSSIVHTGPPGDWNPEEMSLEAWSKYCAARLNAVLSVNNPFNEHDLLIMDRGAWGSAVYGPLFRPETDQDGYGDITEHQFRRFDTDLAGRGGITVILIPDNETLIARSKGREDEYLDTVPGAREDQLIKIADKYRAMVEEERLNPNTSLRVIDNVTAFKAIDAALQQYAMTSFSSSI